MSAHSVLIFAVCFAGFGALTMVVGAYAVHGGSAMFTGFAMMILAVACVFAAISTVPVISDVDDAVAHAHREPGAMVEVPISSLWKTDGPLLTRRTLNDLVPPDGPVCVTVRSVVMCRDADGERLLLTAPNDTERITTSAGLVAHAREHDGPARLPIAGAGSALDMPQVAPEALVEVFGAEWRAAPSCAQVDEVRMCRDADNTNLVLIGNASGATPAP